MPLMTQTQPADFLLLTFYYCFGSPNRFGFVDGRN